MNLSALTLADVQQINRVSSALVRAGIALRDDPDLDGECSDLEFDMTPGRRAVIRTSFVIPHHFAGAETDPESTVVIEPWSFARHVADPEPDPVAEPSPVAETLASPAPESLPDQDPAPVPEPEAAPPALASAPLPDAPPAPVFSPSVPPPAVVAPPKTAANILVVGGLKYGPLSDEERADILASTARGQTSRQIAARLNRRVQAVSLFLTSRIGPDGKTLKPATVAPKADADAPKADADAPKADADAPKADADAPKAAEQTPKPAVAPQSSPPPLHSQALPAAVRAPVDPRAADSAIELDLVLVDWLAHLRRDGWTAEDDLLLVQGQIDKIGMEILSDQLGREPREVIERYNKLTKLDIRSKKRRWPPSIIVVHLGAVIAGTRTSAT